jgi:hypothetical protein
MVGEVGTFTSPLLEGAPLGSRLRTGTARSDVLGSAAEDSTVFLGLRTLMIVLEDVHQRRGNVMNGSTTESTTWDATSNASMPGLPTTNATVIEGMIANNRVMSRRTRGYSDNQHQEKKIKRTECLAVTYRNSPSQEAFANGLPSNGGDQG